MSLQNKDAGEEVNVEVVNSTRDMIDKDEHEHGKVPFIRIARRNYIPPHLAFRNRAIGLLSALIVGAVLFLTLGFNPITVYGVMINSVFGSNVGFIQMIRTTIPLLGCAIAVGLSFKMKFWNIGAEGQVLIGGVAAAYFAIFHSETFSRPVLLIVMALAAALAGGIWAFIPAFFKAKWGTNETLFTLMQNYLALSLVLHLATVEAWRDPGQDYNQIARLSLDARLPNLFGLHIGWVLILVFAILAHIYITHSKWGYQTTVVGQSPNTARYAGMNVGWVIMRTMLISGAVGGFVGYLQVAGADYTLTMYTAGGVGFTAIIVAWVSQLKPLVMIWIAAFIAILERGSLRIQREFGIEETIASILVGIILFFMIACEFFNNYYVIFRKRKGVS